MARTNLAEIDTTIQTAVDQESETPRIAANDTMTSVAGFWLPDEQRVEQQRAARRDQIVSYHRNRDELLGRLAKAEIEPLAMVPKTAWHRICRDSRLYRIQPNAAGKIIVDTSIVRWFERVAVCLTIVECLMLLGPWVWLGVSGVTWHPDPSLAAAGYIFGSVGVLVITIACLIIAADDGGGPLPLLFLLNVLCLGYYLPLPRRVWLRFLLPDFCGIEDVYYNYDRRYHHSYATVALPTPPADIAAILRRANSAAFKLNVAAAPGAINFVEPKHEILKITQRHQERMTAWRNRPRLHFDPIIYVEHNNAVAIIAQFGAFPIERRVVERVAASEYLL